MFDREGGVAAGVNETQREVRDPMTPAVVCRRCEGSTIMTAEVMEMSLSFLV
jgi:hypothetical protein